MLYVLLLALTALPWTWCQDPVPIQFQTSPVLVASGSDAVFTVVSVFSVTWLAPGGGTLGNWIGDHAVLNPLSQYQGRVNISATQLKIGASRLSDAGNYTVTVTPAAATGLATNSGSVQLRVFDAVGPASLSVPSLPIEGANVSLSCSWSKGTETKVAWSKAGSDLSSDPRVNVSGGSLTIGPANRNDSGQYTCTVRNAVSAQSATAGLTVNYGPDTPQMTKTSSNCVGGGDATVGQTVRLTCSSASLPPAVLSWQYNGQPLESGQSSGGALTLQVFSTNQSGPYVCSASNSVTLKTSRQQIGLGVVGTCLSAGAVAGIVVACFVALVLIIVAVVLILCQRRVHRRLRTVIGHQKENNRPTTPAASRNGHDNPEFLGDRPDPPLQRANRLDQQNIWNTGQGNGGEARRGGSTNDNGTRNDTGRPDDPNGDSDSYRHRNNQSNLRALPQQNPNILIQTGRGEPGTQTVLINLNTLPQQRSTDAQPPTVQVSLASPQNLNNQQSSTNHQQNQNIEGYQEQNHPQFLRNQPHTGPAGRPRDHSQPGDVVHNGYSHNRHTGPHHARYQPEPGTYNGSDDSTRLRQVPWDRLRGTPAYPNHQDESSDTDESQTSPPDGSDSDGAQPGPNPSSRGSGGRLRNPSRRDVLRQLAHGAAQRRHRTVRPRDERRSPAVPTQNVGVSQRENAPQRQTGPIQNSAVPTQNVGVSQRENAPQRQTGPIQSPAVPTQNVGVSQRVTAPQGQTGPIQSPAVPTQNVGISQRITTPQLQTAQTQTSTPTRFTGPASPDQSQAVTSNPVPLTQAALCQHTHQTSNPFPNTIHQTQATSRDPGTRPRPLPAKQANREGQAAPTPPPVLRPSEFKTLPREPLQQPRPLQTIRVMRRPTVGHHRRHNVHRHPMTMRANLNRHPAHMNQPRGFI